MERMLQKGRNEASIAASGLKSHWNGTVLDATIVIICLIIAKWHEFKFEQLHKYINALKLTDPQTEMIIIGVLSPTD